MQRKFVNKHRQKRKYTRKTEETSSFSFSKTAYGMVPLLVMLVAFMSTMVISTPFRDALSHIRFTFEPPQFSLDSPVAFMQSLFTNLAEASIIVWAVLIAIYEAFMQSVTAFFSSAGYTSTVVQHNIAIQKEASFNTFALLGQELTKVFLTIGQAFNVFWYYCVSAVQFVASVITGTIISITQLITTSVISVAQIITQTFTYIVHLVVLASIAAAHLIALVAQTIWNMLVSVATVIAITTQRILNTIAYIIELPFKILYAFWLQIKPYVDVFARHVEMTGKDLSNGFTSMGKVASLLSSSK